MEKIDVPNKLVVSHNGTKEYNSEILIRLERNLNSCPSVITMTDRTDILVGPRFHFKEKMDYLLVVVIKESLVQKIIHCEDSTIQEKIFKSEVLEKSGFEPEDCDYEDGYYEYENGGSICMTSIT